MRKSKRNIESAIIQKEKAMSIRRDAPGKSEAPSGVVDFRLTSYAWAE
ncbi:MAG TPA: hypothetical protein VMW53_07750 [archaeon]|nr:hypothetical protein [archaeon]